MKSGKQIFAYGQETFGNGIVIFEWSMNHQFLCAVGQNQVLQIFDKRGNKIKEMSSGQKNVQIAKVEWDKDNEFIAIMYNDSNFISLWNVFGQGIQQMEMDNVKFKATFIKWSKTHPTLAIGTDKGSLIFFNKSNQKKVPTMGKHAKKITTGDWNDEGLLITGGEDKILTISNHTSESKTESMSLNHEPKMVKWARQKTDERTQQSNKTITAILQSKSLLMYQFESNKQPLELFFEQKYGKVTDYQLFGDGYLVLGFSEGYISHISTHMKEVKDEVSSEQIFTTSITALATNDLLNKLAVSSENTVKIIDINTWKQLPEEKIELPLQAGKIVSMGWSQNGQVLVVSTQFGGLFGLMTNVPLLIACKNEMVATLTSFKEVSIINLTTLRAVAIIPLEVEPQHLALGVYYLAASINNIVWFYKLQPGTDSILLLKKEYPSNIKTIWIQNNIVAVYTAKQVILHNIDNPDPSQYFERKFPQQDKDKLIQHCALSANFLILLDQNHKIKYYSIYDQAMALEYQTEYNLTNIYSNHYGTKCICIDTNGQAYLFLSSNEQLYPIQDFPIKFNQIVWDQKDNNQFCVIDNSQVFSFVITQNNLYGVRAKCIKELLSLQDIVSGNKLMVTQFPTKIQAIQLENGMLFCLGQDGTISGKMLLSHSAIRMYKFDEDSQENHFRFFLQCLSMNKFQECLFPAERLKSQELYECLGRQCLQNMELKIAYLCFQKSSNLSMVMIIEKIMNETEKNVILGHIAMILGQYDLANDFYLKSSTPIYALEMRCDIQDWLIALNLAKTIAPDQESIICRKLGQQVESQGNLSEAQRLYEKAILQKNNDYISNQDIEAHNVQCFAGIARTSIKLGDVNRGFQLANQLGESQPQHLIEIALVCENMKQYFEAAQLYQKAQMNEKAASLYIQLKMFDFATPLINNIKSPKLLSQLAKSKEIEGNYIEAEKAYEKAENWENVIRINLNQLDNLEKAKQILRTKCPTDTCANMMAQACEKKGLKKDAIEFLLLGNKKDEAFALAQSNDCMQSYVEFNRDLSEEERVKVAQYFEGKGTYNEAAKHYEMNGNYLKSLNLYKKAGEEYLDQCIDMIGRAKNDNLTLSLLAYIMGEDDGIPKDPHYAYKVYRVLEKYTEASKIALTIWSQEMERGNYQQAHYYLFDIQRDLTNYNLQVPYEIQQKLMILHSYMIVKRVIRINLLEEAVMLLNRVCKNISQFQQHAVNILTYTVIQATKAKMKGIAYVWSSILCRQEYRALINEKYKKNIENIARRPVQEDQYNQTSPCCYCGNQVNQFELYCDRCQQNIPFCIASGKHIVKEQLCFCPSCNYPAIYDYFKTMIMEENLCPMCNNPVDIETVEIKPELVLQLNKQLNNKEEQDQQQ